MNPFIKRSIAIFAALVLGLHAATGGAFTPSLTPEESQSAGLAKLTPEELARLDALVQRYMAAGSASAPATAKPAAAAQAKPSKLMPDWVSALMTLERAGNQPDRSNALESTLKGGFSGWSGRTVFTLEDGQRWTQANTDSYVYSPTLTAPKIKIYPASFGTYWLQIEGVNQRCRVKPVKLQ